MLYVRSERCLANILGVLPNKLISRLNSLDRCAREYYLIDPAKPGKQREVLEVRGHWREYLDRLNDRLLIPRLHRSAYSHGGVPKRSIVTNAKVHIGSVYAFSADISDFFPSIHHSRVYRLFVGQFGCSPNVARICARLCTHDYHLAVGLPTSPILADQILQRVDRRIGAACEGAGLAYTRYVDDITISGRFNLEDSGFIRLVNRIVGQDGFDLKPDKQQAGKLAGGFSITGIRIKNTGIDVSKDYAERLLAQLREAKKLADGAGDFIGLYCTPGHIYGKVQFVSSINPGRKRTLFGMYYSVNWLKFQAEAERRGLVA